jgi:hypothetical protein
MRCYSLPGPRTDATVVADKVCNQSIVGKTLGLWCRGSLIERRDRGQAAL